MRRLNPEYKQFMIRRARKHEQRRTRKSRNTRYLGIPVQKRRTSIVNLWNGQDSEKALCLRGPVSAPNTICLEKNPGQTISFARMMRRNFENLRSDTSKPLIRRKEGSLPKIESYLDFSKVEYISTSAALIIASEYEKVKEVTGFVPPAVNLETWSKNAFSTLFGIGFFEAVGLASDENEKIYQDLDEKVLKVISIGRRDPNRLPEIGDYIRQLYEFIHPGSAVPVDVVRETLTSVSEGITNTLHHAYPDPDAEYSAEEKIWITASANRKESSLTIVLLDHGRGIPTTYQKLEIKEFVTLAIDRLMKGSSEVSKDAAYIAAAMRYGRSQTMEPQRGKGLPQMRSLIRRLGHGGSMTVYSNRGWWQKPDSGRVRMGGWKESLDGTLIEWKLRLPQRSA